METAHLFESLSKRYNELSELIASPALENAKRHLVQKELSYISTVLKKYRELQAITLEKEQLEAQKAELGSDASPEADEMRVLFDDELAELNQKMEAEKKALDDILYPADPLDNRSVFLEVRAGTGGQEAALFASDLVRMYTMYALKHGWKASVVSMSETDLGGIREVVLHIEGKDAFGRLKRESGVHRVQRVPKTETQGRIHTSTATVAVLPEAEEVELTVNPADLRIDVYRAGGAGGQHVNTTDSAVRITHIPTGVVVTCQDERSQHKNKAKALKVLQSRLLSAQREKHDAEMSKNRKNQVGSGDRSEKVRTYNFPQNRVTDHQVDVTLKKLDMVMEGDVGEIFDALQAQEKENRKQQPLPFSVS